MVDLLNRQSAFRQAASTFFRDLQGVRRRS